MRCPGSQQLRGFSPAQVTRLSDATGKASRARVSCPECGRQFVGRVVRGQQGVRLDPAQAVVPNHNSK